MIYKKVNPIGIDVPIQKLQQNLFDKLLDMWSLDVSDYKSYGRCYRNSKEDGYVPEMFVSEGKQYQDLFLDDNHVVTSFFGCEKIPLQNESFRADVHLIFAVNLTKVGINVAHRADEEVRMDVYRLLLKYPEFVVNEIVIGSDSVFREYTAWKKLIPDRDMQPNHFFRINFTLNYIPTFCSLQLK